jgi:hypothetical protein
LGQKLRFKGLLNRSPIFGRFWVFKFCFEKNIEFQKRKLGIVKRIQRQIDKFALTNEDLNFVTN